MTRNEEIQKLINEETGIDNFGGFKKAMEE